MGTPMLGHPKIGVQWLGFVTAAIEGKIECQSLWIHCLRGFLTPPKSCPKYFRRRYLDHLGSIDEGVCSIMFYFSIFIHIWEDDFEGLMGSSWPIGRSHGSSCWLGWRKAGICWAFCGVLGIWIGDTGDIRMYYYVLYRIRDIAIATIYLFFSTGEI